MTSPDTAPTGLRERKRADTRLRIERAAVAAVLRLGLEGATIDRIAADAEVSPRTFFNYFATKEAAVLGMAPLGEHDDLDQEPRESDDLVEDLVRVVVDVFGASVLQEDLRSERHEVLRRHPEIGEAAFRAKNELLEQLAARAERRLPGALPVDRHQLASTVAATCVSAVRVAFRSAGPGPDPTALRRDALALVAQTARVLG